MHVSRLSAVRFALLMFALAVAPRLEAAEKLGDWPQWRGPNRDGHSPDKGLLRKWPKGGPELAWKSEGLGKGYSSVSLGGGRIYTMGQWDGQQHLLALDGKNGRKLWSTPVGKEANDGPNCTPTFDGDRVYALGTEGDLVCCDAATGQELWRKNFAKNFDGKMMSGWGYSESPLVDGEKLIVTPGGRDAALVALDRRTGRELWRTKLPEDLGSKGGDGAGYSSIVVSNAGRQRQYVQLLGRGVVGVSADDGRFLWNYNGVANDTANIPTPIVKGDYVFCSTGYGTGSALLQIVRRGNQWEAVEKYFLPAVELQNHHGGLILVGDYLYGGHGHNNGFPICVELATGKIVWRKDRGPGTGSAAVTYADGNLYFRYDNGLMALIAATPKGYQELGTFEIADGSQPSWPHPVVADGKLYLRDQDRLLVYGLTR
ncbi:MAG: PQQ-binding-like beta-propeller repeat protein [Pirellulales bacterium]